MENAWKAHQRIDALATSLAQEMCNLSSSVEEVGRLFARAHHQVQMSLHLGVMSSEFQHRVSEHQQRLAREHVISSDARLEEQLAGLGIDSAPIFADRVGDFTDRLIDGD